VNLADVTPLILTYNEAANLERTLEPLAWARRIVVVDSGSTDGTSAIARKHANVEVFDRRFDRHASQWNFGLLETRIDTEWVLALDADYVLTAEFVEELKRLEPPADVSGYRAPFRYCVDGRALRASLYPPVTVLYRRRLGRYLQDGHTQRLRTEGRVLEFHSFIRHDDRKAFSRWRRNQDAYMRLEADSLSRASWRDLSPQDKARRALVAAPLAFLYCLFVKGLWREGLPGLKYSLQRTLAEAMLTRRLAQRYLGMGGPS